MFSPDLDLDAVTAFLRGRFDGLEGVESLGAGEWSAAFAFRAGGVEYVLRVGDHPEDYAKDAVAARFAGADLPVPAILEIGEGLGGWFAVSRRLPGVGFDGLDTAGFEAAMPSVLQVLDAIRVLDVSSTRGYGIWTAEEVAPYGSWRECLLDVDSDPVGGRTHGWRGRLRSIPWATKVFDEGVAILEGLVEHCPEARHVIHADLMGDNMRLLDGRVTAVVDWGTAMYGDFLYDVARLVFWTPWFPEMRSLDVVGMAREHYESIGLEVPRFEERLRACLVHLGLDAQAYNAFTSRWDELGRSGERTLELGRGELR